MYPPHEGWFDPYIFSFNREIESRWEDIRAEALKLLAANHFVDHEQSRESERPDFKLANRWKVFSLHRKRKMMQGAIALAPVTWSILSGIEQLRNCEVGLTYFSLVPAGGIVDPHISPFPKGARIRNQLCLKMPENPGDDVEITVNGQSRQWQLGKLITFDDAYRHHVRNLSNEDRLVLIYDVSPNP